MKIDNSAIRLYLRELEVQQLWELPSWSFELFYKKTLKKYTSIAYYIIKSKYYYDLTQAKQVSQQIINNVMVKLYDKFARIEAEDIKDIESYLFVAVKNEGKNHIKRKKITEEPFSLNQEDNLAEIKDSKDLFLDMESLPNNDVQLIFDSVLLKFDSTYKDAWNMYKDGVPLQDISKTLQINYQTLANNISIIKKKIKIELILINKQPWERQAWKLYESASDYGKIAQILDKDISIITQCIAQIRAELNELK